MKTGRVTLMTTEFCEVMRKPSAFSLCWMFPGWILVLFSGSCIETTAQSLEIGHFNEMDSVQLVDSWDSIFFPEDFGLTLFILLLLLLLFALWIVQSICYHALTLK